MGAIFKTCRTRLNGQNIEVILITITALRFNSLKYQSCVISKPASSHVGRLGGLALHNIANQSRVCLQLTCSYEDALTMSA